MEQTQSERAKTELLLEDHLRSRGDWWSLLGTVPPYALSVMRIAPFSHASNLDTLLSLDLGTAQKYRRLEYNTVFLFVGILHLYHCRDAAISPHTVQLLELKVCTQMIEKLDPILH